MKVTRNFDKIYATKKRVVLNRWWSSSSKTYSIMQMFFKRLTTWEFREDEWYMKWVWSVVRQFRSQLEWSVLRDWKNIVEDEKFMFSNRFSWWWVIKENKSNLTYEYEWRVLEFIWLDDFWKAKWPRRKILYCNEADQIKRKVFSQLLMRTEWPALLDWNPDDDEVWLNTEIEQKRMQKIWDVELIVSTFRDNWYLSDSIVKEILALKELDPEEWEVYWNWSYWKIKGAIFTQWVHWDIIGELPEWAELKWYWQDFWFTNDPTTAIWVHKYDKDTIILDQKIWETWLVNTYIDEERKQDSITWHYEMVWINKNDTIFADSSEPKSIKEIEHDWYDIYGVTKWPWSVVAWIKQMKKYKLLITARSLDLIKEFKKYVWKTDKQWNIMKDANWKPIPKDAWNHGIDWSRYWITHLFEDYEQIEDIELSISD